MPLEVFSDIVVENKFRVKQESCSLLPPSAQCSLEETAQDTAQHITTPSAAICRVFGQLVKCSLTL